MNPFRSLGSVLVVLFALIATALAKPLPKGRWNPVLVKDATWSLPFAGHRYDDSADSLTMKVADVRAIAGAQVARLSYEMVGGTGDIGTDDENSLPGQVAVTKKGVYLFADDASDADIKKALKKKPMFPAAGSTTGFGARKDGSYAMIPKDHPEAVCYGWNADPSCGAAPCDSWLCFDDKGVVAAGQFGPNGAEFGFAFSPGNPY